MKDANEIAYFAFRLVREQRLHADTAGELHRMANFFADASDRLSQIIADEKRAAARQAFARLPQEQSE